MEDGKQVRLRTALLLLLFLAVLAAFFYVLYDTQIVNGASYRQRSSYSVPKTETVETSRGEILDAYGHLLVSNATQYQVTLDTSLMGSRRSEIIAGLLEVCRQQGMTWTDTLPITQSAPYAYTSDDGDRSAVVWLRGLCEKYGWDAGELVEVPVEREREPELDPDTGEPIVPAPDAGQEESGEPEEPEYSHTWVPALTAQEVLDKLAEQFKLETDGLTSRQLRELVGVLYELALREREVTYTEYIFAQNVDIRFITLVKERKLTGVTVEAASTRQYHTTYASHILGRVGPIYREEWLGDEESGILGYKDMEGYSFNSIVGKDGVERAFESWLHGVSGVREVETDASGKLISGNWREGQEPQPGGNVVLTLDLRLQTAVEDLLAAHIEGLEESDNGAAVVVDMTGGVLAMASYPGYDLSRITDPDYFAQLTSDPLTPMVNFATQGTYAPGSIFKPCTAIAGLQEGVITPTTKIRDTGYYTYFTSNIAWAPKCWIYRQGGGTHGQENVTEAIRDSCNVFFYDVGRRVGIEKLSDYAHMFGLGVPTGIELYEDVGHVAGPETSAALKTEWVNSAITSVAIGQENNKFTPLQLANYIATLINGGTHYAAHLLKSVKSSDYSSVLYEYEPQVLDEIGIDPANLEAVKQGMYQVTQTYSVARYFNALPVKAGAKTGTAQVNSNTGTNATFVCFAPYDDPQIALCLVVEKGSSGASLAKLAADILQFYFTIEQTGSAVPGENQLLR